MTLERALKNAVRRRLKIAKKAPLPLKKSGEDPPHLILGKSGEDAAAEFLESRGFEIIVRNVRYTFAEIDIIAKDNDEIVFVEVRTRSGSLVMPADKSVGPDKIGKLLRAVNAWVEAHNFSGFCRVDLIALTCRENEAGFEIEHIRNITEGIS